MTLANKRELFTRTLSDIKNNPNQITELGLFAFQDKSSVTAIKIGLSNDDIKTFLVDVLNFLLTNPKGYPTLDFAEYPCGNPKTHIEIFDKSIMQEKMSEITQAMADCETNQSDLSKFSAGYLITLRLGEKEVVLFTKRNIYKNYQRKFAYSLRPSSNIWEEISKEQLSFTFHFDAIFINNIGYFPTLNAEKFFGLENYFSRQAEEFLSDNEVQTIFAEPIRETFKTLLYSRSLKSKIRLINSSELDNHLKLFDNLNEEKIKFLQEYKIVCEQAANGNYILKNTEDNLKEVLLLLANCKGKTIHNIPCESNSPLRPLGD